MSKEAIERMLFDPTNAYYQYWQEHKNDSVTAQKDVDMTFYLETLEEIAYRTHGQYVNKLKSERIKRQMEDVTYNTPPPWDEIVVHPRIEAVLMSSHYEESTLFDVSQFLTAKQMKQIKKIPVHP